MSESIENRHHRALSKFSRADAQELRRLVLSWEDAEEVTLIAPSDTSMKILALLDSHAIVHDYETEARQYDVFIRALIDSEQVDE